MHVSTSCFTNYFILDRGKTFQFTRQSRIASVRRCELYDLSNEVISYADAWKWQKDVIDSQSHILADGEETRHDTVIMLQHEPVYTLGTKSTLDNLKFDPNESPVSLFRTERGGEVTYHGPGQLVIYPILDLRHHKMDLHWYLRSLEEVVILALNSATQISSYRVEGMTGVWSGGSKLAAIGVRVTKWVTYHGFALNVTTDLKAFDQIVPCGLNLPVGSVKSTLKEEGRLKVSEDNLVQLLSNHLLTHLADYFSLEFVKPRTYPPFLNKEN